MCSKLIIAIILSVLCFIQKGEAIKCYDCRSDLNENCGESFDGKDIQVTDCSVKPPPSYINYGVSTKCTKTVRNVGSTTLVTRACYFENPSSPNKECMHNPNSGSAVFSSCEICDEDLCNSAAHTYAIIGTILSLVTCAIIIF